MAATSRSTAPARSDRDRLRDYYGLAGPDDQAASSSAAASSSSSPSLGPTSAPSKPSRDALPTSIPSLLRSHASLLTSMRELDGERQSLVYNHHGDLVAASQTISKMKEQSDQLTATLQGLQRGLEGMGKWEGQLAGMKSVGGVRKGRQEMGVDIEKDVAPIVTLPERLRDAAALRAASEGRDEEAAESARGLEQGLAAAEALWGRHESVLSSWASQGVAGAGIVADECRAVLRELRERAAAANAVGVATTVASRGR